MRQGGGVSSCRVTTETEKAGNASQLAYCTRNSENVNSFSFLFVRHDILFGFFFCLECVMGCWLTLASSHVEVVALPFQDCKRRELTCMRGT
jgi:hypothetical protein